MELASATSLDGHDYSNFRTAVGKLIFMAPWRPDMQFAIQQLSTQVLNPKTESKRSVKELIRYLKGTQHTCFRLESRGMVQKGLLELVGRSDLDWSCDSATRQSVTGYHCIMQDVTMCNRSLKQTAISFSSCEAAPENFWDSQNSSRYCTTTYSSSRDGFRFGTTDSTAQRTGRTVTYRYTILGYTTVDTRKTSGGGSSGHEEQYCRSLHETSGWTENAVGRKETWTLNPG